MFSAVRSTAIEVGEAIVFNQVTANVGAGFNSTAFTAPVAGVYRFTVDFQIMWNFMPVNVEMMYEGRTIMMRPLTSEALCAGSLHMDVIVHMQARQTVTLKLTGAIKTCPAAYQMFAGQLLNAL